jgi:hypothetical protein
MPAFSRRIFTGGEQQFTVPAGVTTITIESYGAQGANGSGPAGGTGGWAVSLVVA